MNRFMRRSIWLVLVACSGVLGYSAAAIGQHRESHAERGADAADLEAVADPSKGAIEFFSDTNKMAAFSQNGGDWPILAVMVSEGKEPVLVSMSGPVTVIGLDDARTKRTVTVCFESSDGPGAQMAVSDQKVDVYRFTPVP